MVSLLSLGDAHCKAADIRDKVETLTKNTELDLRGYQCPLPVLKTRNAMRKLELGERILILTDDPLAAIDIPAFCNESGQVLIHQSAADGDSHRFLLERRGEKL
ncbi:MAG: response regulator SirA [Rhizobiaceae bacterium]|nr:response regulator SirA [Rhizobiaceae bacterium]